MEHLDLGFPLWVRLTHFFNIMFLSLLIRSGIEILHQPNAHSDGDVFVFFRRSDIVVAGDILEIGRAHV